MQMLAAKVTKEISERGLCAIYNDDLKRVWPKGGRNREQQIHLFAKEHGWRVSHYTDEFIAILTPEQSSGKGKAAPSSL